MTICQNVAEKTGMLTFKRSLLLVSNWYFTDIKNINKT